MKKIIGLFAVLALSVVTVSCARSENPKSTKAGKVEPAVVAAETAPKALHQEPRKIARPGKVAKPIKTEESGEVLEVNDSKITYKTGNGREKTVSANSFPSLLQAGDKIIVKKEKGKVFVIKDRGMKIPIGC
ncbi:MAG: hypothetical protein WA666_09925 [Nitrospirota bacterium]